MSVWPNRCDSQATIKFKKRVVYIQRIIGIRKYVRKDIIDYKKYNSFNVHVHTVQLL
jgi:hypothetical protein